MARTRDSRDDNEEGPVGLLPRPDPTLLTTEQLRREVQGLREIIEARLHASDEAIATRLTHVDGQVGNLKALHEEKFHSIANQFIDRDVGINTRFKERDDRSEREARDNKIAVDAAFAAQKEAVAEQNKSSALAIAKSEAATTKQIDQLQVLIQATNKASDDKVDDLKARVDKGEGHGLGVTAAIAIIVSIILAVASLITVVILISKSSQDTVTVPVVVPTTQASPAV